MKQFIKLITKNHNAMLKDHPKGLFVAFFANMGERFGYYTMLAIFTLFLQAKYGFDSSTAGQIYGGFPGCRLFSAPYRRNRCRPLAGIWKNHQPGTDHYVHRVISFLPSPVHGDKIFGLLLLLSSSSHWEPVSLKEIFRRW